MKLTSLFIIYGFILSVVIIGIPLRMNITGLSLLSGRPVFQTSSESIMRLLSYSSEIGLYCNSSNDYLCVRPKDYSDLKANFPVQLEACNSQNTFFSCDDLMLTTRFKSRDLIRAGLRL